jgi:AraC-like DNA-binding protein
LIFHYKYKDFSFEGIPAGFAATQNTQLQNGRLQFNPFMCRGYLQSLMLPGDIGIIFSEYDYERDTLLDHLAEEKQSLALWLDLAESDYQYFSLRESAVAMKETRIQKNAYLVNTALPFTHLRSKGTKGKSLTIFFPDDLAKSFLSDHTVKSVLTRYYALKADGLTAIKILPDIEKNINGIFYQWDKYRNVLSITKYTYRLIEWYCKSLLLQLSTEGNHRFTDEEATDLFSLQQRLDQNIRFSKTETSSILHQFHTPAARLEELFKKVHHKTITAYLKDKKLEEAFHEITTTEEPIASIAYGLGYANPSNLSVLLKKKYNITPQELRRNLIKEPE